MREQDLRSDEGVDAGDVVVVVVSVPSVEVGESLAEALVADRLGACVKRSGPVLSTYRWEGAVEHAEEWRLEIVTVISRFDALVARVGELHPYEVPEIIALAVAAGEASYLQWVRTEVSVPTRADRRQHQDGLPVGAGADHVGREPCG